MRIAWESVACEPEEVFRSNARHACSLGLPLAGKGEGSLAIAGGGPSLSRSLDLLSVHDEVWGVNRTAQWLCERGIPAALFTVDPQYMTGMTGVERAVLASSAHPRIFEELRGRDVSLFHIAAPESGGGFVAEGGPSSVCRAVPLAVHMGFSSVTFYGCEGSYEDGSHVYPSAVRPQQIVIRADGRDHVTQPDLQLQCEYLASFIRAAPDYFREASGGLLRAMLADPDWRMVAVSGDIASRIGGDLPHYELQEAA